MSPIFSKKTVSQCSLSFGVTSITDMTLVVKNDRFGNVVMMVIDEDGSKSFKFTPSHKNLLDKFVTDLSNVSKVAKNVSGGETGFIYNTKIPGSKLYMNCEDGSVDITIVQDHAQSTFKFRSEDFDVLDRFKNEIVKIVSFNQIQFAHTKSV
mgnify:CR=1 FL=1